MGIRQKLLGVSAILITVPLLMMGGSSYIKASNLLEDNFIASSVSLNQEISASLESEFTGYLNGIQALAGNYNAKTIIEHPEYEKYLMDAVKLYVENYPSAESAYVGVQDGTMRIYPDYKFDSSYDPRQRSWYKLAKETKAPGWTPLFQSASTGKWSISGTAPIFNEQNKFIGAVATGLDLSSISKKIGDKKIGETGYVFVVDHTGLVIAHPNSDNVGTLLPIPEIQTALDEGNQDGVVHYEMETADGDIIKKIAVYEYMNSMEWYILTTIDYSEITNSTSVLIKNTFLIGLITLLLAGLVSLLAAKSLIKPITSLVSNMGQVEAGDLTVQSNIKRRDELGVLSTSFNNMISNVQKLVQSVSAVTLQVADASQNLAGSAEEVSASSTEVTETIEEIAKGASEQAIDTQNAVQIADQLDQKFSHLQNISEGIATTASTVENANKKGSIVLSDLKDKSDNNNASTHRIAKAINELEEKSKDIDSILVTITTIADQTNLLALNASIEAARAGEHGRGFAVVADEIRKLAEESSNSADKIGQIVSMIQVQTGTTVQIMDEFKENSASQYSAVEEMDKSFSEISLSIDTVGKQIEEIDDYIGEMLEDKNKIVSSVTNISSVSEETAAASEEVSASMEQQNAAIDTVASAAEQLNELSIQLSAELKKFKI